MHKISDDNNFKILYTEDKVNERVIVVEKAYKFRIYPNKEQEE